MASIPNANALAVATRLYSLAPTPRTLGSRVWATASATSQVPAITAGTTAVSSGVVRAAVIHGMPAARAASTTAATMTVSDTWRRTRYRQAHRAPESLGSLCAGAFSLCAEAFATAVGVTRSPRRVAAGRCRLGISVMAGSARLRKCAVERQAAQAG